MKISQPIATRYIDTQSVDPSRYKSGMRAILFIMNNRNGPFWPIGSGALDLYFCRMQACCSRQTGSRGSREKSDVLSQIKDRRRAAASPRHCLACAHELYRVSWKRRRTVTTRIFQPFEDRLFSQRQKILFQWIMVKYNSFFFITNFKGLAK